MVENKQSVTEQAKDAINTRIETAKENFKNRDTKGEDIADTLNRTKNDFKNNDTEELKQKNLGERLYNNTAEIGKNVKDSINSAVNYMTGNDNK